MNASRSPRVRCPARCRRAVLRLLLATSIPLAAGILGPPGAAHAGAAEAVLVPPPVLDVPTGAVGLERAVFAGGRFWGVQGVYQHVDGVTAAVSGYSGGEAASARYREVSRGGTGHAEAVEVTYDPSRVSYGTLLRIFFSVVHDPTQVDRQGPDVGTQYRSAIFPASAAQREVATAYIAQLEAAGVFDEPIATRIETGSFFPAESVHQDYMLDNPRNPYIVFHDLPKLRALETMFPQRFRAEPIRVKQPAYMQIR